MRHHIKTLTLLTITAESRQDLKEVHGTCTRLQRLLFFDTYQVVYELSSLFSSKVYVFEKSVL